VKSRVSEVSSRMMSRNYSIRILISLSFNLALRKIDSILPILENDGDVVSLMPIIVPLGIGFGSTSISEVATSHVFISYSQLGLHSIFFKCKGYEARWKMYGFSEYFELLLVNVILPASGVPTLAGTNISGAYPERVEGIF